MFFFKKTPPPEPKIVHPFYPVEIEIVDFVANDKSVPQLLVPFLGGLVVILATAWLSASRFAPHLRALDKTILLWFILTGTIHIFFEGYFVYNHTRMAAARDYFGQLWKEYALSDSRYLISDPLVLSMETITAICWGPLSYLMVYLIAISHPLRYPLQAVVSLAHIYGDTLYYATSLYYHHYKDVSYCRPEAYYFWFYFVFMNFIWILVPGLLLYQSMSMTTKAFKALDRMSRSLQSNVTGGDTKPHHRVKKV